MRGLLLLLLALPALAQVRDRDCRPTRFGRTHACADLAFAEFAPASGAGMPLACSGVSPTGAKGEAYVYARAGSVWCTADDYSLVSLGANVVPVMRGRSGAPLGVLIEPAGQNDFLQNRDLSNAATTKTSMTCAKTATGADGVANSASTCTSSGANGTALQAIVRASGVNSTSMYIRRRTGTGAVQVTRDNGTTWNAITIDSNWRRVVCRDTEGCMGGRCIVVSDMCATSANPTVGIRLVTSGDAVDVDLVQNEAYVQNTSPITAAGSAGTRSTVTSSYFDTSGTLPVARSISVSTVAGRALQGGYMMQAWQSNTNFMVAYASSVAADSFQDIGCFFYSAPTGNFTSQGTNTGSPLGGSWNMSCDSNGTTKQSCTDGQCFPATATVVGDVTGVTRVHVGTTAVGSSTNWLGVISEVCLDGTTRCDPPRVVRPLQTHILWLGDSITFGNVSTPTRPPFELYTSYARASSRMVQNGGVPGDTVAQMKVRWDGSLSSSAWGTLVFLGGINDLRTGASAAATYATAVQILNGAIARGMRVVVVGMLPWQNYTLWTVGKQTESDAYNALLSAWATANGQTYVSTDSMGTGSPLALSVAYDSGDGLHPNAAGSTALAALVAGATP